MVDEYGLETVQEYMRYIRANAESSVRHLLVEVARRVGSNVLTAVDYLDDGTPVNMFLDHSSSARSHHVTPDSTQGGDRREDTLCGARL